MGTVSSPVWNTVRSATVKGVMRLSRMKPLTPPATSHTKDTRAHQKARRRKRKQGDSVTSTIRTFVRKARGSSDKKRHRLAGPSVKVLWLNSSATTVTRRASSGTYRNALRSCGCRAASGAAGRRICGMAITLFLKSRGLL